MIDSFYKKHPKIVKYMEQHPEFFMGNDLIPLIESEEKEISIEE